MKKLYHLWIRIKYQYYKLYWKVFPPKRKSSGFYGWHEVNYCVLDQNAICVGVINNEI